MRATRRRKYPTPSLKRNLFSVRKKCEEFLCLLISQFDLFLPIPLLPSPTPTKAWLPIAFNVSILANALALESPT